MKKLLRLRRRLDRLEADVAELMSAVEENRRLNERLYDVLDVVTELLVPAMDRDDERVRGALTKLLESRQRAT
ncbi:MAG: hypothetical protein J7518_08955 [Nocardioidaceae bacterium]|nr:hypothetical protein [Nocardioidaceae bacterium]